MPVFHRLPEIPKTRVCERLVALSACADAYRVILGETEEKIRQEERAEQTREARMIVPVMAEGKREGDEKKKSSLEKLGPAALGTVAGVAAGTAGPEDIAVGLAIERHGVAGELAARNSGPDAPSAKSTVDFTINVKWDVNRLERDLPVLLKRVKDAGFAPISFSTNWTRREMPTQRLKIS